MKKVAIIITIFVFNVNLSLAQLKGNGPIISQEFSFQNFDKLKIEDFDGQIEVEIGKPYSIKIEIDQNLNSLLEVNLNESKNQLNLYLKGNQFGKLYLENTNIKIHITMPKASLITHRGNSNLNITGIVGKYFKLKAEGNGSVFLEGKIDSLEIKKNGNGEVKANKLIAKLAKVKSNGNGNVVVNSQISLTANGIGNCSVIQVGQGKIEPISGIIGNGEVRKM